MGVGKSTNMRKNIGRWRHINQQIRQPNGKVAALQVAMMAPVK
jgi:hypothetical protein